MIHTPKGIQHLPIPLQPAAGLSVQDHQIKWYSGGRKVEESREEGL